MAQLSARSGRSDAAGDAEADTDQDQHEAKDAQSEVPAQHLGEEAIEPVGLLLKLVT